MDRYIPPSPIYVAESTLAPSYQTMAWGVAFSMVPSTVNDVLSKRVMKILGNFKTFGIRVTCNYMSHGNSMDTHGK